MIKYRIDFKSKTSDEVYAGSLLYDTREEAQEDTDIFNEEIGENYSHWVVPVVIGDKNDNTD